jgi:transcriptional regulator
MYVPDHFRVADHAQMHALMRARPFATLVSAGTSGLLATHLPTVLKLDAGGGAGVIECHVARANPHWKEFGDGLDALMIFQGAEAYIRPGWYPSKHEHGEVVPTWNYAAVHAYGHARAIADRAWLAGHVSELSAQQERDQPAPWATSDAPASYITAMLRGIVGIRFEITRIEGKWKMSQNREATDRAGTAHGLRERAHGEDAEIADLIDQFAKATSR